MNKQINQHNSSSLILPPGYTNGSKIITRRNFLKLAGASAVALPFLRAEEAIACPSPLPQCPKFLTGTQIAQLQHYRDNCIPFQGTRSYDYVSPGFVPGFWYRSGPNTPNCFTIYPDWDRFHNKNDWYMPGAGKNGGFDIAFYSLFSRSKPGDMISIYQEAATQTWATNGHRFYFKGSNGVKLQFWQKQAMEGRMWEIAHGKRTVRDYPAYAWPVRVGAIDTNDMNHGNKKHNHGPVKEWMYEPLDWFGMDCYANGFDKHHVAAALDTYEHHANTVYSKYQSQFDFGSKVSVCVCECNTLKDTLFNGTDPYRANYFNTVADWVATHYTEQYRGFYTFWNDSKDKRHPPTSGGPFSSAGKATISALSAIGNGGACG